MRKLTAAIEHIVRILSECELGMTPQLSIVLAAARAYACEECDGSGYLEGGDGEPCQACKSDREVADG